MTKSPKKENNEFDAFGKTVVCQLKKLPQRAVLESMGYIQSYMIRQRLKNPGGDEYSIHNDDDYEVDVRNLCD